MIIIESRRKSLESLKAKYPDAMIIDVTSKAQDEFVKFSPFYPNGGIPVPFTDGLVAVCVEGIWQGLKVFETADVDRTAETGHCRAHHLEEQACGIVRL